MADIIAMRFVSYISPNLKQACLLGNVRSTAKMSFVIFFLHVTQCFTVLQQIPNLNHKQEYCSD